MFCFPCECKRNTKDIAQKYENTFASVFKMWYFGVVTIPYEEIFILPLDTSKFYFGDKNDYFTSVERRK